MHKHGNLTNTTWKGRSLDWDREIPNLTSHTLASISRERGSGDSAYSKLFCDKVLSLAAHAHRAGPTWFAVTHDLFLYSKRTTRCMCSHQTLFLLRLKCVACKTKPHPLYETLATPKPSICVHGYILHPKFKY